MFQKIALILSLLKKKTFLFLTERATLHFLDPHYRISRFRVFKLSEYI